MEPQSTLWPLDPHTRGKHLVLEGYLGAWFVILGSWAGRILFIDGFAGPGEYTDGEPGSPLIALNTYKDHRSRHLVSAEVIFWFVEKDPRRAEHLEQLIERIRPDLPPKCRVYVGCGVFDAEMTETLDALDAQKSNLAPSFVMVDPFGVSGTPMTILRRILANPRSEVYVSFMYEAMNRFKNTAEFAPHLDELFGTEEWRDGVDIADPGRRKDFFYELYDDQLRNAGAEEVVRFELYEGNRLVYAIFFGTHSTKGSDRMKQAIWKVAPFGDFAFRGTRAPQLSLGIDDPDYRPLQQALITEFGGGDWVVINDILDFVKSDRTDYHSGQLRKGALIPMETAGSLEADEKTRRKRRTYPTGTKLRFLTDAE